MGQIKVAGDTFLRAFTTDGVPSSGANEPDKGDGRVAFAFTDASLSALALAQVAGGAIAKDNLASLNADLAHAANKLAFVVNDSTASYNGVYIKVGGSGSGSWTLTGLSLPVSFINDLSAAESAIADVQAATIDTTGGLLTATGNVGSGLELSLLKATQGDVIFGVDGRVVDAVLLGQNLEALDIRFQDIRDTSFTGGGALSVSGSIVDQGVVFSLLGATSGDITIGGTPNRVVMAEQLKPILDGKLGVAAKASLAETAAGTDIPKWINPYALKVQINNAVAAIAASENPASEALQGQIDVRMLEDFSNAVFDDDGATGAASVTLANVIPSTGRGNIGLGRKVRSFEDVSTGLSSSAYASAIEALIQASINEGGEVLIPANIFTFNRGLVVEGFPTLRGPGSAMEWRCAANAANLTCHLTKGFDGQQITDVRFVNTIGTLANHDTTGILLTGNCGGGDGAAAGLIEHIVMNNIRSDGCYSTIDNQLATYATPHGDENRLNHSRISNITSMYSPNVLNAKYGLVRRTGSGTGVLLGPFIGNIARFENIAPWDTDPLPAHIRDMAGAGVVVGDITNQMGQLTGLNVAGWSYNGLANYLARINHESGQVDAQAASVVRQIPEGVNPGTDWKIDVTAAGTVKVGNIPMLRNSRITTSEDVQVHTYDAQNLPGGTQLTLVATLDLAGYDGTILDMKVAGLCQGVGGGIWTSVRRVAFSPPNITSTTINEGLEGTANTLFFKITPVRVGTTNRLNLFLDYTANVGSLSSCSIHITATGGTKRLLGVSI